MSKFSDYPAVEQILCEHCGEIECCCEPQFRVNCWYAIAHKEDANLLWSNSEGWTEGDNFESFKAKEIIEEEIRLPVDGVWMELRS